MCLPCKSNKVRVWSFMENRMTGYPIKFDHNEVEQLRKKFYKMSGNKESIDKPTFQQNMGILGLHSVYGFSDRLFNSFDTDIDGKISFQDFIEYMEVLKAGSQKHKARISFRLIDVKNSNRITIQDFKEFLDDYFRSWTSITNSIITPEIKQTTDEYVSFIFDKVKRETEKDYIDFKYYQQNLFFNKEFTDAFEFITEGVANMFMTDRAIDNDGFILLKVLKSIRKTYAGLTDQDDPEANQFGRSSLLQHHSKIAKQNEPSVLTEEFPKKFTNSTEPKFSNTKLKPSMKNDETNPNTTFSTQIHNCKNCLRVEVLQKKLEYLSNSLKELIEETNHVFNRLEQKLYNSTSKSGINMSNVHNRPQNDKPEGNMVFVGDDDWNQVLNMMIGIQMAVRSVRGYQQMIYEQPKDFNLKYYFELVPRRFGDEEFLSRICNFTDYAPSTFNHIRKIFAIDNEEYINSIGPKKLMTSFMLGEVNSLSGLTSQGKSGSFFYYTPDGKYMLKTIHEREYRFLRSILESYYFYLKKNPDTMITKFFGLHKIIEKDQHGNVLKKSYFTIMGNVFNTTKKVIERYDIKGSSYGRQTKNPHPNSTKKDNDFLKYRNPIELEHEQREKIMQIVRRDAQFFRKHQIIDYSLLIGVVRCEKQKEERNLKSHSSLLFSGEEDLKQSHFFESVNKKDNEGYIFGIIDILTKYDTRKAAEYYLKSILYGSGISAVPPDQYAERFVEFIDSKIFKKTSALSMKDKKYMVNQKSSIPPQNRVKQNGS